MIMEREDDMTQGYEDGAGRKRYTTDGSVRGSCGHAHMTLGAAERCRARDEQACRAQGGRAYSDREVRGYTGRARTRPLTDDEQADLCGYCIDHED